MVSSPHTKKGDHNANTEGKRVGQKRHWELATLTNTDHKILTKAMAIRLQKVISSISSSILSLWDAALS